MVVDPSNLTFIDLRFLGGGFAAKSRNCVFESLLEVIDFATGFAVVSVRTVLVLVVAAGFKVVRVGVLLDVSDVRRSNAALICLLCSQANEVRYSGGSIGLAIGGPKSVRGCDYLIVQFGVVNTVCVS